MKFALEIEDSLVDIINEFSGMPTNFGFMILSLLHDFADFAISMSFISYFSKFDIPYVTSKILP